MNNVKTDKKTGSFYIEEICDRCWCVVKRNKCETLSNICEPGGTVEYDLCEKCYKAFLKFMDQKKAKVMKLNCITAAALSALLLAVSVFLGNVGHTEYKSQMRKRKARKTEVEKNDSTITTTVE